MIGLNEAELYDGGHLKFFDPTSPRNVNSSSSISSTRSLPGFTHDASRKLSAIDRPWLSSVTPNTYIVDLSLDVIYQCNDTSTHAEQISNIARHALINLLPTGTMSIHSLFPTH
jgi:hypothetical protein